MHVISPSTASVHRIGRPRAWEGLCFDCRVPRRSVHKSAAGEVLLSDAVRLGDERFAVAASWHRDHFLAHLGGHASDPVLLAETVRQAAIYLSHRFHGVPYGHPFVLGGLAVDLDEPLPGMVSGPLALRLEASCRRREERGRVALGLDVVVHTEDRPLGRARVHWSVMEARRYAVLRKRGAVDRDSVPVLDDAGIVALPPASVGQRYDRDVLLAADAERLEGWWLRLDHGHPVLFDHPSDHIPGMALVEAFRQAARAAVADHGPDPLGAQRRLESLSVTFSSFGELDLPVFLTAEPADDQGTARGNVLLLRAVQGNRELAHARMGYAVGHDAGLRGDAAC
ncbi:ScbA/BarX family gamma-butyrolactone biosynthesis protein [Streptomyces sp. NPDC001848]|uniref:ScbA/BarX family gamma-butyrolactone biosynthesis protein n=1 Tax=Streptomyces sp. NPDC001848 TaxID=3364618 RepID=UPI0036C901EA